MVNGAAARGRLAPALAAFASLVPLALALAFATHALEVALAPGLAPLPRAQALAAALANDVLAVARYLPLLFTALVPALLPRPHAARVAGATGVLALGLLAGLALAQYALKSGVPLGADLFTYSRDDLRQAVVGVRLDGPLIAGALLGVAACAAAVAWRLRRAPASPPARGLAWLAAACVAAWAVQGAGWQPPARTEYLAGLQANKLAWFIDDLRRATRAARAALSTGTPAASPPAPGASAGATAGALAGGPGTPGALPADARFPFLHAEQTPDVLGDWLALDPAQPPNIALIIVEGLGRSFSGPGASLGSFTPFLDELAARSLYWDDFLATQGRTFGVLPSLLGSVPFGAHGFLDLPQPLPAHPSLPSLLAAHGYDTRFLSGTNAAFDGQLAYLQRTGFGQVLDRGHLDLDVPVANEWGYDDDALLRYAAALEARPAPRPWLDVIQTISMHSPFTVPDEALWRRRAAERIAALGLDEAGRRSRMANLDVYASVLFTDDALRRYVAALTASPAGARTLVLVTGDHRLPEIPMDERIERYHVPLLIASPLVRAPHRFRGISSHFDVAPTLVAMFAAHYDLQRPARTPWLGGALATGDAHSDGRSLPMMQTKSELSDFVLGEWYLGHGRLYHLGAGLVPSESDDARQRQRVQAAFDRFLAANARFAAEGRLLPAGDDGAAHGPAGAHPATRPGAATAAVAHVGVPRAGPAARAGSRAISVPEAAATADAAAARIVVRFALANAGEATSVPLVPLAVLLDGSGHELQEAYGQAVQLQPRERLALHLGFEAASLAPGTYYVAVFASDPGNGARIGEGRFHLPVAVDRGASP